MSAFSKYYIDFLLEFIRDVKNFFVDLFLVFWQIILNIVDYFDMMIDQSSDFGIVGWLFAVIITLINLALAVFIGIRLWQFLRRYFIFRKRQLEKEELLEEVAMLNEQVANLVDEKNNIMNLKLSALSAKGFDISKINQGSGTAENNASEKSANSRFIKLTIVDEIYRNKNTKITMGQDDAIGLTELVERFVNFSASQLKLYYTKKTISVFFAGLATSKIMILEGISGTGKTSLPYAMGKFFKTQTQIISVQPSWRDRAEILGYLNEFTKRFVETDFLKCVYEVTYREDINFIILDEMNLARIEYYFADFLSMMEMPDISEWKIDLVPSSLASDPVNLIEGKLLVPQNVWFIGTANKDDSTFTITDKVYDRATTLEFRSKGEYFDAPYTENLNMSYDYLNELFQQALDKIHVSPLVTDNLNKLDQFIQQKFKLAFGNRILKQINTFIPVYVACGGNEVDGLDYLFAHKILRKFESLNIGFMTDEVNQLILLIQKLFGKNKFTESIQYLQSLMKMM